MFVHRLLTIIACIIIYSTPLPAIDLSILPLSFFYDNLTTIDRDNNKLLSRHKDYFNQISNNYQYEYCTCDLQVQYCDIDCCCDNDCDQFEKYSFHSCQPLLKQPILRHGLCQSQKHIFSRFRFDSDKSTRLMCLAKDNANRKQTFANQKTIADLHKLLTIKPKHRFKWSDNNLQSSNLITKPIEIFENVSQVKSITEYKSGYRIVLAKLNQNVNNIANNSNNDDNNKTTSNYLYHYWKLPFSVNFKNEDCNYLKHVKYLYSFNSICRKSVPNLQQLCIQDKSLDISSYSDTKLFMYANFVHKNYQLIAVHLKANYGNVFFNQTAQTCHNVVDRVEYTVWHKGILGIYKVDLQVNQVDLPRSSKFIRQTFNVIFKSVKDGNNDDAIVSGLSVSGNPGYLFEKPIIFSQLNENSTYEIVDKSLINYYKYGVCNVERKLSNNQILFGVNQRSSCRLRLYLSGPKEHICNSLQAEASKYIDTNFDNLNLGMFGNISALNSNNSANWLKVINLNHHNSPNGSLANNTECNQIIGVISYEIYYVKVGSIEQPQNKIIGAGYRSTSLTDIELNCAAKRCILQVDTSLVTSVNFFDISEPSRPDYAPPPAVKIELPSDFFYPFQTSSSLMIYHHSNIIGITIVTQCMLIMHHMF